MTEYQKLTVTGTGDSLFVSDLPKEYDDALRAVAEFIKSCDVKITNLETNLSDFEYYAGAYSGSMRLTAKDLRIPAQDAPLKRPPSPPFWKPMARKSPFSPSMPPSKPLPKLAAPRKQRLPAQA